MFAGGGAAREAGPAFGANSVQVVEAAPVLYRPGSDARTAVRAAFVNTAAAEFRLDDVRTTCGCTNAEADFERLALGAAGTAEIGVRVTGIDGRRKVTVSLIGDGDRSHHLEVLVPAYPWGKFENDTLHVGRGEPGAALTRTVALRLHAAGGGAFPAVAAVRTTGVVARAVPGRAAPYDRGLAGGVRGRTIPLTLDIALPAHAGAIAGGCEVDLASGGEMATLRLHVAGSVAAPLRATPARVFLKPAGGAAGAAAVERTVTLRRTDGRPLAVASVTATEPHVTAAAEAGGRDFEIRIRVDPSGTTGRSFAEVVARTDDGPELRIPVIVFRTTSPGPPADPAGAGDVPPAR